MVTPRRPVSELLSRHHPRDPAEAADLARVRELAKTAEDPWLRSIPLHLTASALIVHPGSGKVLLRWHQRQQAWMQVGGHGDPGEADPVDIALREGSEETALTDLVPWPDAALVHVVIVPVPAAGGEPAHEHADLRFVLATADPAAARPEQPDAPLRWLTLPEAHEATSEANVHETLSRAGNLLVLTRGMSVEGEYEPSPSGWVRDQVELYESSGGMQGTTLGDTGLPVVIITNRGACSGKLRKTPLMRVEHDGRYAAIASQGGAPTHPSWYYNFRAHPQVKLQDGARTQDMIARELTGSERAGWWDRAVTAYPPYADYQRKTERQIPVFVLEPADRS